MDLSHAVAVVTGATGEIGSRVADSLSEAGATVARWDLDGTSVDNGFSCDVSDAEDVERAFALTEEQLGSPTILVNAAGVSGGRAPSALDAVQADDDRLWHDLFSSDAAWMACFGVNVLGTVHTSRMFSRSVHRSGRPAAIVNITSIAGGAVIDPRFAAYGASKAAGIALTRNLALNLGPLGISVNAVAPGVMETGMKTSGTAAGPTIGAPPAMRGRAADRTPLGGRMVSPAGVSTAIMALLTTDQVTGQILIIDGGITLNSFITEA